MIVGSGWASQAAIRSYSGTFGFLTRRFGALCDAAAPALPAASLDAAGGSLGGTSIASAGAPRALSRLTARPKSAAASKVSPSSETAPTAVSAALARTRQAVPGPREMNASTHRRRRGWEESGPWEPREPKPIGERLFRRLRFEYRIRGALRVAIECGSNRRCLEQSPVCARIGRTPRLPPDLDRKRWNIAFQRCPRWPPVAPTTHYCPRTTLLGKMQESNIRLLKIR